MISAQRKEKPERFTINALRKGRHEDEPATGEAPKGQDAQLWRDAIEKEIYDHENMICWKRVDPPRHEKIFHTKYALQRKRDGTGNISKYKARFVVCGNEEHNENEAFSPLADFTVVKLILCLALQNKWKVRHYDFQNAFLKGISEIPVDAYPPKHFSDEKKYRSKVLKSQHCFYGLKDAAKIWCGTVSSHFKTYGLKKMESAPCAFQKKGMVVICYVSDLLIFDKDENEIRNFKINLQNNFSTKY